MVQTLCPKCSCDAASVLSYPTNDGCFTASVQCHVCGFEKSADQGFPDERTAREAATQSWLDQSEPIASSQHRPSAKFAADQWNAPAKGGVNL
jgi:hypothetical protein